MALRPRCYLRLVAAKHGNLRIEMLYDVVQVGMATRHNDGDEILHALVDHHFAFEEKKLALITVSRTFGSLGEAFPLRFIRSNQ